MVSFVIEVGIPITFSCVEKIGIPSGIDVEKIIGN